LRVEAEQAVAQGPWPSLVLRPAAIYGPGRGVHVALREGSFQLANDGSNFVSRIHVDDLATHAGHSLLSDLTGAYPVADEKPCSSREIAEFCANLLGLPLPESVTEESLSETRRSDRRVDGSAIRRLLGIELRYPSYRQGIPAALKEEGTTNPVSEPPA
jgi:nucleoside-diphosphate-sugar epimerase